MVEVVEESLVLFVESFVDMAKVFGHFAFLHQSLSFRPVHPFRRQQKPAKYSNSNQF